MVLQIWSILAIIWIIGNLHIFPSISWSCLLFSSLLLLHSRQRAPTENVSSGTDHLSTHYKGFVCFNYTYRLLCITLFDDFNLIISICHCLCPSFYPYLCLFSSSSPQSAKSSDWKCFVRLRLCQLSMILI
jgi:hypothetical protein